MFNKILFEVAENEVESEDVAMMEKVEEEEELNEETAPIKSHDE